MLLTLIDRLCKATDVTLIYITHHPEEVIDSIDHVMHLVEGRATYVGERRKYQIEALEKEQ